MVCTDLSTGVHIASRMSLIPRSCIREILSAADSRKLISFGGGVPHHSCIPTRVIELAFEKVMSRHGAKAFAYGSSEGEPELREFVASWLRGLGIPATSSQVLIVNGSQQGLDLLGKVLIDTQSPVVVERPTYLAALQALGAYDPLYREVPLDQSGPDLDLLADQLGPECRFLYAIPSFQNPSGTCYSEEARMVVARLLDKTGVSLVEDDPYSQLYYDKAPPPPICALGPQHAFFLGTFSKMIAPGLRLGWIWTNTSAMNHLITAKQATDLCTGTFQQLLLLEVLKNLDLAHHLNSVRAFYRQQRDLMASALRRHLRPHLSWNNPSGGMFFWASLHQGLSVQQLLARCVKRGVAFGDGGCFHASGGGEEYLRLNFTQASQAEMDEGMRILSEEIATLTVQT